MGLANLDILHFGELKNNIIRIQGQGVGLAISPLLSSLFFVGLFLNKWARVAGACLYSRGIY